MRAYFDLHNIAEDQRIQAIGETCMANPGKLLGLVVETEDKADRYAKKLLDRFPLVEVVDRSKTVADCILVRIRRKADA